METILIVDDEKNYRSLLQTILEEEGYKCITAENGLKALSIMETSDIELLITDVKMPSMDGTELLDRIRTTWPDFPVIMMTAHATVEKAVDAMQKGAYSYIEKPFDNERLILFVDKALTLSRIVNENKRLRNEITSCFNFDNIIGKSRAMQDIFTTIKKVAPTTASVLIEGESGTGKELVAKSIHFNSLRKNEPFIVVNCSALSESLLESELFGHEKGAFTGALSTKKGRIENAHGGTLFLDEIGEISLSLQVKLLRVLQEKTIERVGSTRSINVDFRLIAATNKNLLKEVTKGAFREDLYYRLNVVYINIPPLRNRQEDINLLMHHFLQKFSLEHTGNVRIEGFDPDCRKALLKYPWPGNIRQLENCIERAMIMAAGEMITLPDLPDELQTNQLNKLTFNPDSAIGLYETIESIEKQLIINALEQTNGIQSHAACLLKIGKSGLHQKIKKHGLFAGDYTRDSKS